MFNIKILLLLIAAFLNLMVAVIVLFRDYKKLENISFFGIALGTAGWVTGIAGFFASNTLQRAFIWAKFYYLCPLLIVVSSIFFAQYVVQRRVLQKWLNELILFAFLVMTVLLIFIKSFITQDVVTTNYGKKVLLDYSGYFFYALFLLFGFIVANILVYQKTKIKEKSKNQQAKVFLLGYSVSTIIGVSFNLLLPLFDNYSLIWVGPLASTVFVFATAYAIVKHRLFDIRLVVARSLGYVLSISLLALFYGGITYVSTGVLSRFTGGIAATLTNIVVLTMAAISYAPTKRFFDKQTNRIFYRDAYDPQTFLDQLNKVLVSNIELNILLRHAALVIESNIKCEYCLFVINKRSDAQERIVGSGNGQILSAEALDIVAQACLETNQKTIITDDLDSAESRIHSSLNRNNIAVVAQLATGLDAAHSDTTNSDVNLGYIVFGAKKSGNPYNKQDIKTIGIITDELLIAIQNSLRFEEIESFAAILQEKVNDATHKLQRTNEKLKQLDETKDEFISMASHQLRTPLTSVKGYLSMTLEGDAGKLNDMQKKLLGQAFISSQRMVYLIADLLNVSRLKTGKFIIEAIPSNLADVVEGEVSQLIDTAKGRGLVLSYKKPAKFPTLMLDETKIRQVIMNFTDNAIYYTPSGGHITLELVDKKNTVEFTVSDNGIGVPAAEQHHLFSKFYRAANAQKARPDGTGLGLFMAQKVIVAQGGSIIFHSKVGKGSTFGFSFPKAKLLPPVIT